MKIYINNPEGYFSRNLIAFLTAQQQHEIDSKPPTSESINTYETIVLDLNDSQNESSLISFLSLLKDASIDHPIIVIGISSVLTWNGSKAGKVLKESQYKKRQCSERYNNLKMLETLVLNTKTEDIKPFIVAPGVLYGQGEHQLHELFRAAWMQEETGLPIIGSGNNNIPLIHITDFISFLNILISSPPLDSTNPYFIAVEPSNTTQQELVNAVSNKLGNKRTYQIDQISYESALLVSPIPSVPIVDVDILTMDLKFSTEGYLNSIADQWEWISGTEGGFISILPLVCQELIASRHLFPLRIWLYGPPASGKSFIAQKIAEKYYLPIIQLGTVIEEARLRGDELTAEINNALDTSAAALAAKQAASTKKSNKKIAHNTTPPKPSLADYENNHRPHLSVELLTKLMKRKLSENRYQTAGFVLDGYPRTAEEAKALWKDDTNIDEEQEEQDNNDSDNVPAETEKPAEEEKAEDEQTDNNNDGNNIDESTEDVNEDENNPAAIVPKKNPLTRVDRIIVLFGSLSTATERYKSLPYNQVQTRHNDEEGLRRRYARYSFIEDKQNQSTLSPLSAINEIEPLVLTEPFLIQEPANVLSAISVYLDAGNTKRENYHPTPQERLALETIIQNKQQEQEEIDNRNKVQQLEAAEATRLAKIAADKERMASVLAEDAELVNACAAPLRSYLLTNVLPGLIEGLVEVVKVKPADPIDYLAEWLYKFAIKAPLERPPPLAPTIETINETSATANTV